MKRKKEVVIGIVILAVLILIIVGIKVVKDKKQINIEDLTQVYVAVRRRKRRFFSR